MARNTIQTSDFDFTVERVPLTLPNTNRSRVFAHVRTDTGEELGWGTEQYGFVQNADLIGNAEEAFESRGMTPTNRQVVVTGRGERMFAQYDFENETAIATRREDRTKGMEMGMRLTLQNSFDRSLRVSFALGMVRLVCLNGMTTMEKEFGMTRKHSSNVEIGFIGDALDKATGSFHKAAQGFSVLGERDISQEQGRNILNQLGKSKVLSNVVRDGILKVWENPTHEEDEARNLWTLYNAATQHLTHEVSPNRFEYANTVSTNVLRRLRGAAENSDKLNRLVVAVPTDTVVTESDVTLN
tara:strand:- start:1864 stop:2760 length:897 start_codon:yes stop_codon:yes gene_type:complete